MPITSSWWLPVLMLVVSNVFMTFAWYGHLKHKEAALWKAILASWGIALLEYVVMAPANRWGSATYSPYQLKVIQEVVTLAVFVGFALLHFGARPQWNHLAAFACIAAAVGFAFVPAAG
jgi:uncharacterized protein (DUF486 family)